jgi:hypothetical protein
MEERIRESFTREMRNLSIRNSQENSRKRRSNWIDDKLENMRNYSNYDEGFLSTEDKSSSTLNYFTGSDKSDKDDSPSTGMKIEENSNFSPFNLDIVNQSLQYLYSRNYLPDKIKLKQVLKIMRKEFCKSSINIEDFKNILNYNGNNSLLSLLTEFLFDFKNSEIQLEALWILNNLCSYCKRYHFDHHFVEIHKILVNFMQSENNFSNTGVKNLIFEKFFSLVGNLILNEEEVLHFYLANNILYFLIKNLNCSVRSLRGVLLMCINNIIQTFNKLARGVNTHNINNFQTNQSNLSQNFYLSKNIIYTSLFNNKEIAYYLKFIFSRIEPTKNFEESYEFLWLLNYFSHENFDIFLNLFITKEGKLNHENVRKIIYLIFCEKLFTPALRILGSLISLPSQVGNDNNSVNINLNIHVNEILQIIFSDNNLFSFLSHFLQKNFGGVFSINYFTEKNENFENYDDFFSLAKEILWFVKNLCYYNTKIVKEYLGNSLRIFLSGIMQGVILGDTNLNLVNKLQIEECKNLLTIFYYLYSNEENQQGSIENGFESHKLNNETQNNPFNTMNAFNNRANSMNSHSFFNKSINNKNDGLLEDLIIRFIYYIYFEKTKFAFLDITTKLIVIDLLIIFYKIKNQILNIELLQKF